MKRAPKTLRSGVLHRFSGSKWRPWLGVALAIAAFASLEAVPGFPGHQQASLLGDLAASDAGAVVTGVLPFHGDHSTGPCATVESNYEVGNRLLKGAPIGWYATVWQSYQALNAMYVASLLPGGRSCRSDLLSNLEAINAKYWDTSYGPGPAAFDQGPHALHLHWDLPRVDDSLWMGLAVIRAYRITRDPAYLRRAEAVFHLAVGNWDPAKGGIYWEYHAPGATNYDKTVVSNAPAVVMGAALYAETADVSYRDWSGRILQWLESNLVDHRTGLYDDHVDDHGRHRTVDPVKFTYNQGIMVGAMAALARVDPQRYPVADAVGLATRAVAYFQSHHSYGQPEFDAIWADNLLATAAIYPNADFARQARASVKLAVQTETSHPSGLLAVGGEMALDKLAELPASSYPALSYVPARAG